MEQYINCIEPGQLVIGMSEADKTFRTGVIYAIKNNANGKVYIGQTLNYHTRIIDHFRELKNSNHYNRYLQEDFNNYGQKAFSKHVLKDGVVESLLNEEENRTIKENGFGNRDRCYNIAEFAELKTSKMRAKKFVFIDPKGIKHSGKNIAEFCAKNKLCEKAMQSLGRGRRLSYKGWVTPTSRKPRTKLNVPAENKILISPENIVCEIKTTLLDFANEHSLCKRQVAYLVNEHIQTYKGWRLLKNKGNLSGKEKYQYRNESYFIKNIISGEIIGPIDNPKQFCEKQNILASLSPFYKMLKGKRKTCRGYVKITLPESKEVIL